MVTASHFDFLYIKIVLCCKPNHFTIVTVSHQKITDKCASNSEQLVMIDFMVCIKPFPSSLPSNCVRGINEEYRIYTIGILLKYLETITLDKCDALSYPSNL